MTAVFVDTSYFVGILNDSDQWHDPAVAARRRLPDDVSLVTTDEVLVEVLASFSKTGEAGRSLAAELVRRVLNSSTTKVVPQSHESFMNGVERYEQRHDKSYSLQDCVAMNVMEAEGIREILTSDHNFEQERFTILMKSDG